MIIFSSSNYLKDFYHKIYLYKIIYIIFMKEEALLNLIRNRYPYCGGFLPDYPFYELDRHTGTYEVWVCPNCKSKVSKWEKK